MDKTVAIFSYEQLRPSLLEGNSRTNYAAGRRSAENHCKDWRVLRNVLAAKGYGLPPFLGGLKRACVM